jgi:hypothetical protein
MGSRGLDVAGLQGAGAGVASAGAMARGGLARGAARWREPEWGRAVAFDGRISGAGVKGQKPASQAPRDQGVRRGGAESGRAAWGSAGARGGGGGGRSPVCQRRKMPSSRVRRRTRQAMTRAASTSRGPRRTDPACAESRSRASSSARGVGDVCMSWVVTNFRWMGKE